MNMDNSSETVEGSDAEAKPARKIRIENVDKRFGRVIALKDITLDIYENQIFGLVGDNGAGKSTLMNLLSGIHSPTMGTIYYDDEPITFANPSEARERGIETVYQDLALMDDLDVGSNIFMGQYPTYGVGPLKFIDWDETYERADHIMHDTLGRSINSQSEVEFLSGGQRQLVAVGRSLAFNPEVIILDEPTSALSVEATDLVHDTLQRLKEEEGLTIVIVSHGVEEVLDIADRIGVLYQGNLVEVTDSSTVDLESLRDLIISGNRGDE
jgi:ABC-type sugar transport system ATPase subunit